MTKNFKTALFLSVAALPFVTQPGGWKKDENGNLVLDGSGNPIYVDGTGVEKPVDQNTIANLNREAKSHREAKEAAEAALEPFKVNGKLIDPATAVKAIETVGKLDAKQLIDAGEVDKVREQIKGEYTQQLTERDNRINDLNGNLQNLQIDRIFDSSDFVRNNIAIPADMFRSYFRNNLKFNDKGEIEAIDPHGNRVMSKKNVGNYADPSEALELLVETHPQKDLILKPQGSGGSGNNGNGGNQQGGKRTLSRAEFQAKSPGEQAGLSAQIGKGELTIVD